MSSVIMLRFDSIKMTEKWKPASKPGSIVIDNIKKHLCITKSPSVLYFIFVVGYEEVICLTRRVLYIKS